ncbi:MAG TPA: hypothetical protein VH482_29825 [Thermomicrobiales bacterium]|jgi:hypothetical protein
MALDIRHDTFRNAVAPARNLPRPGRRAISLAVGLTLMFLLIDAIVHPHTVVDLWTMQLLRRLEAPGLLPLFTAAESVIGSAAAFLSWLPIVAVGLASVAFLFRGRSARRPTPVERDDTGARRSYLEIAGHQFPRSPSAAAGVQPQRLPTPIRLTPRRESPRQAA